MQVLVIGAGVMGLAIGREAALAGHDVIIAEAESHIGSGTSSRNSEVIHAGICYRCRTDRSGDP
jgi:L-2-hydroxyglutarate oxidase LhgO